MAMYRGVIGILPTSVQGKRWPLIGATSHLYHSQGPSGDPGTTSGTDPEFSLVLVLLVGEVWKIRHGWRRIGKQANRVFSADREVVPSFGSLMSILPWNFSFYYGLV